MRAASILPLLLLTACPGLRTESTDRDAMTSPAQAASQPKLEPAAEAPTVAAAPSPKKAPAAPASTKRGPRTVDFRCPAGQAPNGVVRAGCMCGDTILGSACGAGGFTDVTPTGTGCRFTCD